MHRCLAREARRQLDTRCRPSTRLRSAGSPGGAPARLTADVVHLGLAPRVRASHPAHSAPRSFERLKTRFPASTEACSRAATASRATPKQGRRRFAQVGEGNVFEDHARRVDRKAPCAARLSFSTGRQDMHPQLHISYWRYRAVVASSSSAGSGTAVLRPQMGRLMKMPPISGRTESHAALVR